MRPTLARDEKVASLEREPDLGLPVAGTRIVSRDTTIVCACLRFFFRAIFFGGVACFDEAFSLKEGKGRGDEGAVQCVNGSPDPARSLRSMANLPLGVRDL